MPAPRPDDMAEPPRIPTTDLPIEDVLDEIVAALEEGGLLALQAPTGAGKTTRVPLALLDRPWLGADHRLLVLEPRRIAARAAARRMASLLGEEAGATVGYATREERVMSDRTVIEVVTEGILVRRIQRDPSLAGVGGVLFDEFHERSLPADLGLALAVEVRTLRGDLRLGVMSATLEGERVAELLGGAPLVRSEGRQHPVDVRYRPRPLADHLDPHVADAVELALDEADGDVLVFLPGAREIRWVEDELDDRGVAGRRDVLVAPLYGALPPREQDRAIDPAPRGVRKVILSTDIAETSLTIEGVRAVVDAGLTRVPRFDPRTGMSRLVTERVSRASAEQRAGRAGRVAPGVCWRLWSRSEHAGLAPHPAPEIRQADLAGFVLETAAWGVADPGELALLDPPPADVWTQAVELLRDLDALDADGRITEHGRALVGLPLHPRLAHMVARAVEERRGDVACDVAALLSDRDPLSTSWEHPCADLAVRVRMLRDRGVGPPRGARVRGGALSRARREAARLARVAGSSGRDTDPAATGPVLARAYPDRIAQRRGGARGRFLLSNGRGAVLPEADLLAGEDFLVVANVDRGRHEARIHLAAAITAAELREVLGARIESHDVVRWDDDAGDVVAERQERLGELVLAARSLDQPDDAATTAALIEGIRRRGLELLPLDRELSGWRDRVQLLRRELGAPWPDLSDEPLLATLEDWLAPYLAGIHRRGDLPGVPLGDALRGVVGWERARRVDDLAPTHVRIPTGRMARLDYGGDQPVLAVKLQEMFGATGTPAVADGRIPVVVHLLSPAGRPVAITQDLPGFWRRTYPEVRAEMRGRYPKHPWPEDPFAATPTRKTKRALRDGGPQP